MGGFIGGIFSKKLIINSSSRSPNTEQPPVYLYCAQITLRFNLKGSSFQNFSGHAPRPPKRNTLHVNVHYTLRSYYAISVIGASRS